MTRELLETYSKVPPDQLEQHVIAIVSFCSPTLLDVLEPNNIPKTPFLTTREASANKSSPQREKAWDVFPYPCIGQFLFLNLTINLSPYYPTLLTRLRDQNQTLLDLGCCFAQDVRKLVADGAPSENIYGADLYGEFMELGYELFRDRKTLKSTFFPTDILNDRDLLLRGLDGEMDIVYLGLFLHHFDFETCVKVCVRVTKLLKPKPGSLVMGVQVGSLVGDTKGIPIPSGGILWRHDVQSFERVWKEVGEITGTRWDVRGRLERAKGFGEKWQIEGTRRLGFEVLRLE